MIDRRPLALLLAAFLASLARAGTPNYVWLTANEFRGIQLNKQVVIGYPDPVGERTGWTSRMAVFPDTTQGGPTRILSLDAHPDRADNSCWREIDVPATGHYRLWVRYADWRARTEFFKVKVQQGPRVAGDREFGAAPLVPDTDEMKLRVDFTYVWDKFDLDLTRGPARITLYTDRTATAHRDVDVLILTDDLAYVPRERGVITPAYGQYLDQWMWVDRHAPLQPWLPAGDADPPVPAAWRPRSIAGRDFWFTGMTNRDASVKDLNSETFPQDFYARYADSKAPAVMSDPTTAIWLRLTSDQWPQTLTPKNRFAQWLKASGRAFWIESTWPAWHHPVPGVDYLKVLAQIKAYYGEQFLGFYTLEGPFLPMGTLPADTTRQDAFAAALRQLRDLEGTTRWKVIFGADVGPMINQYMATPSFTSPAMVSALFAAGNTFVGNELGDGSVDDSMRGAFNRGLARQYAGKWGAHFGAFAYESGPPSDTRTSYGDWLTGRVGDLYGTSISAFRRTLYMAWLNGSNAFHFEDIDDIYWHHWHSADKLSLTPRGLAIADFLRAMRTHDRGVPMTPIAFLMDQAHGWTNSSLTPYRIWNNLPPTAADYATDQHFEALSWPLRRDMGLIQNDEQVMTAQSIIGDGYDVLVTADRHMDAIDNYRVVWLVGDTHLSKAWVARLKRYVEGGGVLVANVEQARGVLGEDLLGARLTGRWATSNMTHDETDAQTLYSSDFDFEVVTPTTAQVLATAGDGQAVLVQNHVGRGRVILSTPRWMMTRDGWALPLLPNMALHLYSGLLPVSVRGNVHYTINRTATGWLVGLFNDRGVSKMAHAQAVVHREDDAPVSVYYKDRLFKEVTVAPGGVQLVEIPTP